MDDNFIIILTVVPQHETIGIVTSFALLIIFTWSIVAMRLFTKYFYSKLGWDDFFILWALVCNLMVRRYDADHEADMLYCIQFLSDSYGSSGMAKTSISNSHIE
jgi:hypothetical protein